MRNIKFADEMFVLNQRHVLGICDLIIERGYDLNIWAYARVDTVNDSMLDKLKRAGFNWLALGIEAADERVLTDVDKRYQVGEVYDTVRQIKGAGINIIGNYIFGLPEDTHETMQRTLDLALDLNCEFANFYSAMAYPGSPLYEQAVRNGWRLPDTWSGYSQHAVDTLPLPTRHLSAGEVLALPRSRVRHVLPARAVPADGEREVRRRHGGPHPPDDVAYAGEEIFSVVPTFRSAVTLLQSLPARPCMVAARRARALCRPSAGNFRARRPACGRSATPIRSGCARSRLFPRHQL